VEFRWPAQLTTLQRHAGEELRGSILYDFVNHYELCIHIHSFWCTVGALSDCMYWCPHVLLHAHTTETYALSSCETDHSFECVELGWVCVCVCAHVCVCFAWVCANHVRDNPRDAWVECAHAAADMYVVAHLSIYIEIYVITHISIYMYIRLYVYLYSPVVWSDTCVYIYVYTCTCMCIYACWYIDICMNICTTRYICIIQ